MKEEILQELNDLCRDTLVDHLGIIYTAVGDDWLEARMPVDRRTCRPDGKLHGGANMALAETVAGALSTILQPTGERSRVFGIEVNGNHMRQPPWQAHPRRAGRNPRRARHPRHRQPRHQHDSLNRPSPFLPCRAPPPAASLHVSGCLPTSF